MSKMNDEPGLMQRRLSKVFGCPVPDFNTVIGLLPMIFDETWLAHNLSPETVGASPTECMHATDCLMAPGTTFYAIWRSLTLQENIDEQMLPQIEAFLKILFPLMVFSKNSAVCFRHLQADDV